MAALAAPSMTSPVSTGSTRRETMLFGSALRGYWTLDPATRHLNHGGFGATPKPVLEEQARWRRIMESNPPRFFMNALPGHLRDAARELAAFVGTSPDRLGFIDNATTGTAAVLRELDFAPGDEILTTDHVYNALRNLIRHVASRTGAVPREAPLPAPVARPEEVVEAIRAAMTSRTRLVVVDHVASGSAMTFPLREIVALCRERGVPILVDGAHAPGLLDLDVDAIGADWYVGNCHKWLSAPKGAAFIAVAPEPAAAIHPLAISHAYGQGFTAEFDKTGTRDATAWLSVPAAIRFHEELGGRALRERNRRLARSIGERIAQETGLRPACDFTLCEAMVALRIPGDPPATREAAFKLHDLLYDRHGIEAATTTIGGKLHLRFSVAAYNEDSDYDGLGEAILAAGRAIA